MQTLNRTIIVNFRLNRPERRLLTRLAETERRKNGEVIREALRDLGERRGLWPPTAKANSEGEESGRD